MTNHKKEPSTEGSGEGGTTKSGKQFKLIENHTTKSKECQIGIAQMLRARDAMIALERQVKETRIAFDAEIVAALQRGGGHD